MTFLRNMIPAQPVTLTGASNTLQATHAWQYLLVNHSSATQLTVPPSSSVAFKIGTVITGAQIGAGQVEIVAGSGVTVNTSETLFLAKQGSPFSLIYRGSEVWDLAGDLELA